MKASDYFTIWNESEDKEQSLLKICNGFIRETAELVKTRKIKTPSGLNGVLTEQRQKWISLARKTGGYLKEGGYVTLIAQELPDIAQYFKL